MLGFDRDEGVGVNQAKMEILVDSLPDEVSQGSWLCGNLVLEILSGVIEQPPQRTAVAGGAHLEGGVNRRSQYAGSYKAP